MSFDGYSQTNGDYQSVTSGNWGTTSTWNVYNFGWGPASVAPTSANGIITIQASHNVSVTTNFTVDQVVINTGGILTWTGGSLTIANGAGTDLSVDGEFRDYITSSTNIAFSAGATWSMNSTGTFVKNNNNSSVNWRNAYAGGITSIGASTTWIVRKNGAALPNILTSAMYYGNLIVENTSGFWDATGPASQFQGASAPIVRGNFDVGGSGAGTVKFYDVKSAGSPVVQILGNLTVRTGSTFQNNGSGFSVAGNLIVLGIIAYLNTPTYLMVGANSQTISGGGTLNIYKLTINKSANAVTLARPIAVDNLTTFSAGIVFSDAVNLFILKGSATTISASNTSHVDGPVKKIGNTSLLFPTGDNGKYQAIGISAPATSTDEFTAQYFDVNATGVYTGACTGTLDHISSCDYWILNRTLGTSNVSVSLTWSANNSSTCVINDFLQMTTAKYDGTNWVDVGNNSITGSFTTGTITSNTVTSFSPFALGSLDPILNPLPVELLYFDAKNDDDDNVLINWATATEINNDYFVIERAGKNLVFEPIETFDGSGNSTQMITYSMLDTRPLLGENYYRLKQIDYNGDFTYSEIKYVFNKSNKSGFAATVLNDQIEVLLSSLTKGKFDIIDITGKIIFTSLIYEGQKNNFKPNSRGLYFVRFTNGQFAETIKLVY
jgi:hypothetical protein